MEISKSLEQILEVLELLKESIIEDLLDGKEVSTEDAEGRVKNIVRDVARSFNVSDSTILDKCTRQLEITATEFYNLSVRYITRQDNELEEIIASNRRETIDSATQTRILLQKIRGK
jgi:AraC-like DNA-binding protein